MLCPLDYLLNIVIMSRQSFTFPLKGTCFKKPAVVTTISMKLQTQVHKKQVEYHFSICQENSLGTMDQTITTTTSPRARHRQGNWCLLPSVVHRRGLELPHIRPHNYSEKTPRQRSRTARHNRASQAEVRTPYPGPRFPGRYCGTL